MDPMSVNPLGGVGGSGGATLLGGSMPLGAQAIQRCCGCSGAQAAQGLEGLGAMQVMQMQILSQLLQLLMQLMLGGAQGAAGLAASGLGGAGTGSGGAAGGADAGGSAGGVSPATDTAATTTGGTDRANVGIGPGTRVLEIGDSHTVGTYGQELEKLLEGKGATVERHAAVGTNASQWINGGQGAQPLQGLLAKTKPDVVIINLGANSRGGVGSDVKRLAQIAKNSGAQVIWVGPPRTREDMSNPAALKKFDDAMRAQLQGLGTYISSAPYTSYDGPDGIHYNAGAARKWAQGVFSAIV